MAVGIAANARRGQASRARWVGAARACARCQLTRRCTQRRRDFAPYEPVGRLRTTAPRVSVADDARRLKNPTGAFQAVCASAPSWAQFPARQALGGRRTRPPRTARLWPLPTMAMWVGREEIPAYRLAHSQEATPATLSLFRACEAGIQQRS